MDPEARCGNCQHWGTDEDREEGQPFRTCRAVEHDDNCLAINSDFWDDEEKIEKLAEPRRIAFRQQHRAVVIDGSGYFAALKTRDDFACNMHEPTPTG